MRPRRRHRPAAEPRLRCADSGSGGTAVPGVLTAATNGSARRVATRGRRGRDGRAAGERPGRLSGGPARTSRRQRAGTSLPHGRARQSPPEMAATAAASIAAAGVKRRFILVASRVNGAEGQPSEGSLPAPEVAQGSCRLLGHSQAGHLGRPTVTRTVSRAAPRDRRARRTIRSGRASCHVFVTPRGPCAARSALRPLATGDHRRHASSSMRGWSLGSHAGGCSPSPRPQPLDRARSTSSQPCRLRRRRTAIALELVTRHPVVAGSGVQTLGGDGRDRGPSASPARCRAARRSVVLYGDLSRENRRSRCWRKIFTSPPKVSGELLEHGLEPALDLARRTSPAWH